MRYLCPRFKGRMDLNQLILILWWLDLWRSKQVGCSFPAEEPMQFLLRGSVTLWADSQESQTHSRGNERRCRLWGREEPPCHSVCLLRAVFDPPVYWGPPLGHFLSPRALASVSLCTSNRSLNHWPPTPSLLSWCFSIPPSSHPQFNCKPTPNSVSSTSLSLCHTPNLA